MKYFFIFSLILAFAIIVNGKTYFEEAVESGMKAEAEALEAKRLGLKVVSKFFAINKLNMMKCYLFRTRDT